MAGTEATWPEREEPAESVPAWRYLPTTAGTVPWQQGWESRLWDPPAEKQHHFSRWTMLFATSQELGQRKPSSPWKSWAPCTLISPVGLPSCPLCRGQKPPNPWNVSLSILSKGWSKGKVEQPHSIKKTHIKTQPYHNILLIFIPQTTHTVLRLELSWKTFICSALGLLCVPQESS